MRLNLSSTFSLCVIFCLCLLVVGCDKFGAETPNAKSIALITGECLQSNELQPFFFEEDQTYRIDHIALDDGMEPEGFEFCLLFDLNEDLFGLPYPAKAPSSKFDLYVHGPNYSVFELFGDETQQVVDAFNTSLELIKEKYKSVYSYSWSYNYTFYYNNGLVIKADREFGGVPAGENLAESIAYIPHYSRTDNYVLPEDLAMIPGDARPMRSIFIRIPIGNKKVVDEEVSFHVEIPIKVGMFLTMLKDRLTNPNTVMQCEEELFTCDFTIDKGLH